MDWSPRKRFKTDPKTGPQSGSELDPTSRISQILALAVKSVVALEGGDLNSTIRDPQLCKSLKNGTKNGAVPLNSRHRNFPISFLDVSKITVLDPFLKVFEAVYEAMRSTTNLTANATNLTAPLVDFCVRCAVAARLGLRPRTRSHARPSASLSSHSRSSGLIIKISDFSMFHPALRTYQRICTPPTFGSSRVHENVYFA